MKKLQLQIQCAYRAIDSHLKMVTLTNQKKRTTLLFTYYPIKADGYYPMTKGLIQGLMQYKPYRSVFLCWMVDEREFNLIQMNIALSFRILDDTYKAYKSNSLKLT